MVGSNLVVTVSNGEFSRTMKGFERPVDAPAPIGPHMGAPLSRQRDDDAGRGETLRGLADALTERLISACPGGNAPATARRAPDPDGGLDPAEAAAKRRQRRERLGLRLNSAGDSDRTDPVAGMDRLWREADAKLGEVNAVRRRSAIAHVRAAVAASRADAATAPETADQTAPRPRRSVRLRDDLMAVFTLSRA